MRGTERLRPYGAETARIARRSAERLRRAFDACRMPALRYGSARGRQTTARPVRGIDPQAVRGPALWLGRRRRRRLWSRRPRRAFTLAVSTGRIRLARRSLLGESGARRRGTDQRRNVSQQERPIRSRDRGRLANVQIVPAGRFRATARRELQTHEPQKQCSNPAAAREVCHQGAKLRHTKPMGEEEGPGGTGHSRSRPGDSVHPRDAAVPASIMSVRIFRDCQTETARSAGAACGSVRTCGVSRGVFGICGNQESYRCALTSWS